MVIAMLAVKMGGFSILCGYETTLYPKEMAGVRLFCYI
jgi:hypothetical protein